MHRTHSKKSYTHGKRTCTGGSPSPPPPHLKAPHSFFGPQPKLQQNVCHYHSVIQPTYQSTQTTRPSLLFISVL